MHIPIHYPTFFHFTSHLRGIQQIVVLITYILTISICLPINQIDPDENLMIILSAVLSESLGFTSTVGSLDLEF